MLRLKIGAFSLSNAPVVRKTGAFDVFYIPKIEQMLRLKIGAFSLSNAPVVRKTGAFDVFYIPKIEQMLRFIGKNRSICGNKCSGLSAQPEHLHNFIKKKNYARVKAGTFCHTL